MNPNYFNDKGRRHLIVSKHAYPQLHHQLRFEDYLKQTRDMVKNARVDLNNHIDIQEIIDANSPFEYKNTAVANLLDAEEKVDCGILLVHGLTAAPIMTQDLGRYFAEQGYLVRSILVPGNGTVTADLNEYTHADWLKAVAFGYKSLHQNCRKVFMLGISLGAALSWLTALNYTELPCAGLMLCAPAIQLFAKNGWIAKYPLSVSKFISRLRWYKINQQIPPTHYLSLGFAAIYQTHLAMKLLRDTLMQTAEHHVPIFMALADSDETISNDSAINYFLKYANHSSRLLFYTNEVLLAQQDSRIIKVQSKYVQEKILDASHVSITNSPDNYFFGRDTKYRNFDHYPTSFVPPPHSQICFKGGTLYKNLTHYPLQRISYNYDFAGFAGKLHKFIHRNCE